MKVIYKQQKEMDSTETSCANKAFDTEEVIATVKTMLIHSIALNNLEGFTMAIEALHELNAGLNWSFYSKSVVLSGDNWNTPLTFTAKLGRLSMVTTLIEKGADVNFCSHYEHRKSIGRTALHAAAKSGHTAVVDCLLMQGCNVNMLDSRGWTPIHDAICEGNIDVAFKLLENGADPRRSFSISLSDVKNLSVIGRASLMFSVDPYKWNLFKLPSLEWNCLLFAANCHQPQLVEKLIQDYFQKDADCQGTFGKTVLHEAVILPENLNLDKEILLVKWHATLKVVLKAGVSPNIQDHLGKTALNVFFDHVNSAKAVVRKHSKIITEIIHLLQDYGTHINLADFDGRTVLHQAAVFGDVEILKLLLELGASATSQDNDGNTPAHVAAHHCNFEVLQCLLECASHAEFMNCLGDSVLHVAIMHMANAREDSEDRLLKIAETLRCKWTEKLHMNVYGETEYDLAVKFNLERLSHLLLCQMDNANSTNSPSIDQAKNVAQSYEMDNSGRNEILSDQDRLSDTDGGCFEKKLDQGKSCSMSDFDVCNNSEFPELTIKSDTNVNEYLLKLCHDYQVRSLHMDGDGTCHERCTVAKQTIDFVQKLLNLVSVEDKRFHSEVLCTGSAFEGYRIGKPDEFDYMCELKSLTGEKCEIVYTDEPGFVCIQVKENFREEWTMLLSEDGFLDAMKVKRFLANMLCSKSNTLGLVHKTWKLSFKTASYDSCVFCQPLICTSKAGVKMSVFWRGDSYKFMPIDIDITPAIHFSGWPKYAKVPPSHVLKGYREVGFHVVPKSEGRNSLLWRLSFSSAELKILQNVSPVQGACYTALKIIKGQTMLRSCSQHFSHLGFLHTYILKTKFIEELEHYKDSELWQEDKLTDRICSVLECTAGLLSQKRSSQVDSYFLPGHSIVRQADRHFGKCVAAVVKTTLHNIVRLLQKESDLPLETATDGSFTMKFDVDSSSESSDDSGMEFVNP